MTSTALGRLLIVDDEAPVVDVLAEYFSGQGYEVDSAGNGTEALASLRRRRPDLILLDIRMPGIDGVETLRRIRDVDATVPVIMVTANEDVVVARQTLDIGAFDYVAKPFDFSYLDRAVAAGLAHSAPAASPRPPDAAAGADMWQQLACTVFRSTRMMSASAHAATGRRLEDAALAVARHAQAGRGRETGEALDELAFMVGIAAELGDLAGDELAVVESALADARATAA